MTEIVREQRMEGMVVCGSESWLLTVLILSYIG